MTPTHQGLKQMVKVHPEHTLDLSRQKEKQGQPFPVHYFMQQSALNAGPLDAALSLANSFIALQQETLSQHLGYGLWEMAEQACSQKVSPL